MLLVGVTAAPRVQGHVKAFTWASNRARKCRSENRARRHDPAHESGAYPGHDMLQPRRTTASAREPARSHRSLEGRTVHRYPADRSRARRRGALLRRAQDADEPRAPAGPRGAGRREEPTERLARVSSQRDRTTVFTANTMPIDPDGLPFLPSCTDCSTCCFTTLPTAVRVSGDDYERMGDAAEAHTWFQENRCYLRIDEVLGHCAALVASGSHFACGIYAVRPGVCRELARGGAACRAERYEKGARMAACRDGPSRCVRSRR